MSATMSRAEREEFLAGLHVGVLSVASPDGRGPLTLPGLVHLPAGRHGEREHRPRHPQGPGHRGGGPGQPVRPGRAAPYKYVTVEGPVVMEDATDAERLELARRYLGIEGGDAYCRPTPAAPRS
jgi:hypothetical protein